MQRVCAAATMFGGSCTNYYFSGCGANSLLVQDLKTHKPLSEYQT
jgi:hypothetical protein